MAGILASHTNSETLRGIASSISRATVFPASCCTESTAQLPAAARNLAKASSFATQGLNQKCGWIVPTGAPSKSSAGSDTIDRRVYMHDVRQNHRITDIRRGDEISCQLYKYDYEVGDM